jgi:phytanoyl-CoA hydroxylase
MLIDEKKWLADGYGALENYFTEEACDQLRDRCRQLLKDIPEKDRSIFSTLSQQQSKNNYFLESGDKIRYFWEEDAFNEDGGLNREPERCPARLRSGLQCFLSASQDL